jgi:hypothetical protein
MDEFCLAKWSAMWDKDIGFGDFGVSINLLDSFFFFAAIWFAQS